jgi:hypothetical protein
VSVLDLPEWQWCALHGSAAEDIVTAVRLRHGRQFEALPPDPLAGKPWRVRSTGLVGYLPLTGLGVALRGAPKVPIASVFALLERAYDLPSRGFVRDKQAGFRRST